ncbi:hypothetical protein EDB85DRAFT_893846 [Lactarius pseudohatsudake]|nr:hypothetical protein EDB85DRAFT_893846 [Lactarius pseudohatsudake]
MRGREQEGVSDGRERTRVECLITGLWRLLQLPAAPVDQREPHALKKRYEVNGNRTGRLYCVVLTSQSWGIRTYYITEGRASVRGMWHGSAVRRRLSPLWPKGVSHTSSLKPQRQYESLRGGGKVRRRNARRDNVHERGSATEDAQDTCPCRSSALLPFSPSPRPTCRMQGSHPTTSATDIPSPKSANPFKRPTLRFRRFPFADGQGTVDRVADVQWK